MTRPYDGIKIVDLAHVLAGPFAAYQLAVLGAEVIKVEQPGNPDQSRTTGMDEALNESLMGTQYLAQGSNKKSITLDLKTEKGREILKRLVADADVMVENYRAGAFPALGLGYEDMKAINPTLIYCSMTAFGQKGPRAGQTAYDHAIQALSGIMARTGTPETAPLKTGTQAVDYATGTMAAFAISSALFQRERTGKGQHIDCSMMDVAFILLAAHIAGHSYTGKVPKPEGNSHRFASSCPYQTKEGMIMLAATNTGQHDRLMKALGHPERGGKSDKERGDSYAEEVAFLAEKMLERTALEWEEYLQSQHVPAGRVRWLDEALVDPQNDHRPILHTHENAPGLAKPVTVPVCAFDFAHGGPSLETPPPRMGEHNEEVLGGLGFSAEEIAALRTDGVI